MRYILSLGLILIAVYAENNAAHAVKSLTPGNHEWFSLKSQINAKDSSFMNHAVYLSHLAVQNEHGHPVGSVVVSNGKIIGEGYDKIKLLHDPSAHAEMLAIRNACESLSSTHLEGCVIYTSAQPCPMCLSLISLAGIDRVYYCVPRSVMNLRQNVESEIVDVSAKSVLQIPMMEGQVGQILDSYQKELESPLKEVLR